MRFVTNDAVAGIIAIIAIIAVAALALTGKPVNTELSVVMGATIGYYFRGAVNGVANGEKKSSESGSGGK
jgi:hypothetical protein